MISRSLSPSRQDRQEEQSILNKDCHLSIDYSLSSVVSIGDQVRITRDGDNYAVYTVGEIRDEKHDDYVRMGLNARSRVGVGSPFSGTISTAIVAPGLTDEEAEAQSEFVERLVDDGVNTGLVVLAPHGGWIELHTHKQAEQVTSTLMAKNVSSWICKGYRQGGGAYDRWHIRSTDLSPSSFAGLGAIANRRFSYCVSFHGMSADGIVVGGGASVELRQAVADAIAAAIAGSGIDVHVAEPMDEHPGVSPDNVVNWLTANGQGGVQIEQSLFARSNYWATIADAVSGVFDPLI